MNLFNSQKTLLFSILLLLLYGPILEALLRSASSYVRRTHFDLSDEVEKTPPIMTSRREEIRVEIDAEKAREMLRELEKLIRDFPKIGQRTENICFNRDGNALQWSFDKLTKDFDAMDGIWKERQKIMERTIGISRLDAEGKREEECFMKIAEINEMAKIAKHIVVETKNGDNETRYEIFCGANGQTCATAEKADELAKKFDEFSKSIEELLKRPPKGLLSKFMDFLNPVNWLYGKKGEKSLFDLLKEMEDGWILNLHIKTEEMMEEEEEEEKEKEQRMNKESPEKKEEKRDKKITRQGKGDKKVLWFNMRVHWAAEFIGALNLVAMGDLVDGRKPAKDICKYLRESAEFQRLINENEFPEYSLIIKEKIWEFDQIFGWEDEDEEESPQNCFRAVVTLRVLDSIGLGLVERAKRGEGEGKEIMRKVFKNHGSQLDRLKFATFKEMLANKLPSRIREWFGHLSNRKGHANPKLDVDFWQEMEKMKIEGKFMMHLTDLKAGGKPEWVVNNKKKKEWEEMFANMKLDPKQDPVARQHLAVYKAKLRAAQAKEAKEVEEAKKKLEEARKRMRMRMWKKEAEEPAAITLTWNTQNVRSFAKIVKAIQEVIVRPEYKGEHFCGAILHEKARKQFFDLVHFQKTTEAFHQIREDAAKHLLHGKAPPYIPVNRPRDLPHDSNCNYDTIIAYSAWKIFNNLLEQASESEEIGRQMLCDNPQCVMNTKKGVEEVRGRFKIIGDKANEWMNVQIRVNNIDGPKWEEFQTKWLDGGRFRVNIITPKNTGSNGPPPKVDAPNPPAPSAGPYYTASSTYYTTTTTNNHHGGHGHHPFGHLPYYDYAPHPPPPFPPPHSLGSPPLYDAYSVNEYSRATMADGTSCSHNYSYDVRNGKYGCHN